MFRGPRPGERGGRPGGRGALAPGRQGRSGPWAAGKPRPPVAIPGELEGIPEEVSGWNGSELNSERIHVRFSRNRRWNSGGWHRPGKAESGGFSRCRGPPRGSAEPAEGGGAVGHWDRSLRPPPVLNVNCLAHGRPEGWEADSRCGGGRGRGRRPLGPFWGRIRNSRRFERVQGAADSSIEPDWKSESVCRRIPRIR